MRTLNIIGVNVDMRSSDMAYGHVRFTPRMQNSCGGVDIVGFRARSRRGTIDIENLTVADVLNERIKNDIKYVTFDADIEYRETAHEVIFELDSWNARASIHLRVREIAGSDDLLMIEVDDNGDWRPASDLPLIEMLGPGMRAVLESAAMAQVTSHTLELIPGES